MGGICLFDKTWNWSVDKIDCTSALCKLIKSLFLVGQSLNAGSVNFLDFRQDGAEKMRLSCREDQQIIIGLFHSASDDYNFIDRLVTTIKEEFINQFDATQNSLREVLQSIFDEKAENMMSEEELLGEFNDF